MLQSVSHVDINGGRTLKTWRRSVEDDLILAGSTSEMATNRSCSHEMSNLMRHENEK